MAKCMPENVYHLKNQMRNIIFQHFDFQIFKGF